jgi:hypothetical protein
VESQHRVQVALAYVPYPEVSDHHIKKQLRSVVQLCQFLDWCFALYFSNAIVFNDPVDAKQQLEIIRHNITGERRNQRRFQRARPDFSDSANADHKADEVFLGDLGEHCEMVLRAAMNSCSANPASSLPFSITRSGDAEDFQYLQDALEVPYWAFMVKEFGRWRQNVRSLTGPAVVRLLQSVRLELSVAIAELDKSDQAGPDDITPILNGIQARVRVLNDVSESNSQGLLDIEQDVLKCVCRRGHQRHESSVKTSISTATQKTPSLGPNRTSNVLGITVMFLFLLGAFVPGSKGFAICLSHPHAVGSTSDADFWYLLQSNIMWVLGSLLMIIFLRKDGLLSLAHLAMWLFLLTGLAFAVASVSIFTRVNTGWSNLLAFFATCSSIAAVLVAAQGSDQYHQGAANNDLSQKRKGE